MADNTSIEWTDATWNPITGCSIVSPGCTNCYAMRLAGTRLKHTPSRIGLTTDSKAGPVWNGKVKLNEKWLDQPLRWKRPRRIFVCAHGDLFAENVPDEWIDRVFAVMALAPQHAFQVLTKRAARMREYLSTDPDDLRNRWYLSVPVGKWRVSVAEAYAAIHPHASEETRALYHRARPAWPLHNVWLGTSAEDQARAEERIHDLLATPAAVRFVSAEPLLGPIDFETLCTGSHFVDGLKGQKYHDAPEPYVSASEACAKLDWIIVGGESGSGARPMHPAWVRSIRDRCASAGTAFFFKQWGNWAAVSQMSEEQIDDCYPPLNERHPEVTRHSLVNTYVLHTNGSRHGNLDHGAFLQGTGAMTMFEVGKKRAGRLLDGIEHNAMPQVREVPFR